MKWISFKDEMPAHIKPTSLYLVIRCRCGKFPTVLSEKKRHGHGGTIEYIWMECECGMRTKSFSEYDGDSDTVIKQCCEIWNEDRG